VCLLIHRVMHAANYDINEERRCSTASDPTKGESGCQKKVIELEPKLPTTMGHIEHRCSFCREKFDSSLDLSKHFSSCSSLPLLGVYSELEEKSITIAKKDPMEVYRTAEDRTHISKPSQIILTEKNDNPRSPDWTCSYCGKCFSTVKDMNRHISYHNREKSCICEVCGKGFKTNVELRRHGQIHLKQQTGEKPSHKILTERNDNPRSPGSSCPYCGKCFSTAKDMNRHISYHNREKSYL